MNMWSRLSGLLVYFLGIPCHGILCLLWYTRCPAIILATAWKSPCRGPEISLYGPIFFENTGKSGDIVFHDTRRVMTRIFPIRTFSVSRKIRCPGTSWKCDVSRLGNWLILPDFSRIMAYREWMNEWMNERTDGPTDGRTVGRTDEGRKEWMNE